MNSRVAELYVAIAKAQEELKILQSQCLHPGHKVQMFSWRPGALWPARFCKDCDAIVPGITSEENEKCWREYNGHTDSQVTGTEQRRG